jgi:hypothetical protein
MPRSPPAAHHLATVNRKAIKNMQPRSLADLPVTFCDTSYTEVRARFSLSSCKSQAALTPRVQATIGYVPQVRVEEGVPRFVTWYQWYMARTAADKAAAHALLDSYTVDNVPLAPEPS